MPNSLDTVAPLAPPLKVKRPPYQLKLALEDITPKAVLQPSNEELLAMHREMHRLFGKHFKDNRLELSGEVSRVALVAAHMAIAIELQERGYEHKQPVRMLKAGKQALSTTQPRGQQIFARGIRMLMHSQQNGYPVNQPIVVMQGDQALGEIRLSKPFPVDAKDFAAMQHLHGLKLNAQAKDLEGGKLFAFNVVIHRKYGAPKNAAGLQARAKHEPIS